MARHRKRSFSTALGKASEGKTGTPEGGSKTMIGKGRFVFLAFVVALVVLAAAAALASVKGTVKESADFSLLVPEGWEFSDFGNGTVQTYNSSGSYMVELKKAGSNMTEKDAESGVANLASQNKGTGPEKVEMLGLTFYKTVFDKSSMHMSYYAGIKDGVKISINLVGKDHETDPAIQAVFTSIALK
jgi:hypothetical protein